MFKVLKTEGRARRGEFSCAHGGTVQTPVFMNVGTQAAIKGGVSALDLKEVGCQMAKVLKLYRKYYKLLNQKYGNAKEFFTPKITVIEKTVKDQFGREQIETTKIKEPLGGKNFLAELQSGEAEIGRASCRERV